MQQVFELNHPVASHHLTILRDRATRPDSFRLSADRVTTLLTCDATRDLALAPEEVHTPITTADGARLSQRIGLVPILRAGLGMVTPVLNLLPDAEVWHLGFYRDENTLQPVEYYKKFSSAEPVDLALVLDPMLATGGSAGAALKALQEWGVADIRLLSLIAAPEGLEKLCDDFPGTRIFVGAVDDKLNEQAYIVPGLGDAGDRLFNAEAQ